MSDCWYWCVLESCSFQDGSHHHSGHKAVTHFLRKKAEQIDTEVRAAAGKFVESPAQAVQFREWADTIERCGRGSPNDEEAELLGLKDEEDDEKHGN